MDLIQKVRAKWKVPFVQIEEKNQKSMSLAMSLGFQKDKIINWLNGIHHPLIEDECPLPLF